MAETIDSGTITGAEKSDSVGSGKKEDCEKNESLASESANKSKNSFRAEIDTSLPFESVKEAVSRFGGSGVWRPHQKLVDAQHGVEEADVAKVKEQASQFEKDLIVKERETLDILKELEATKKTVEELKLKLQTEAPKNNVATALGSDDNKVIPVVEKIEKENPEKPTEAHQNSGEGLSLPTSAPGFILMELKQAKLNLNKTTNDLAEIRASVESHSKRLEKERISLEKTRERLNSNSAKIVFLEEKLNQTNQKLQSAKDAESKSSHDNPNDISREIQRLSFEVEQFKKMAEAAKSEVLRAISEIEEMKTQMKIAEIRSVAAKKMQEAAKAAEAVALADIKALSNSESSSGVFLQEADGVTLSFEEYSLLTHRAREAKERSKKRVVDAVRQIDEANVSKIEILKRVEEATEEVRTCKKTLKEALNRVEAANRGKLAVEEALRKWRSEHGQKRRSVHNSTKFKNPYPSHHWKDSRLLDVNGLNLVNDGSNPVLRPTLSIGQILSRKLLVPEEFEGEMQKDDRATKPKVSLGQMLDKRAAVISSPHKAAVDGSTHKQFHAKRKKFGFAHFSLLLTKQSRKKKQKKQAPNLRLSCRQMN